MPASLPSAAPDTPDTPGTPDPNAWPARCTRLALAQGSAIDILYRLKQNTGPYANSSFGGLELELCHLHLSNSA